MDVANLLLKIAGDDEEAKATLASLSAELDKFDGTEAAAKILLDGADKIQLDFDDLKKELAKFDATEASAQLSLDGFEDSKLKLDDLDASLDEYGKKHEDATLDVNTTAATAKLDKIKAEFAELRADMAADDITGTGSIAAALAAKATGTFEEDVGGSGDEGDSAIKSIGNAASSAASPMAALLTIVVAMAPALLALVASAAGAAAGFLVLAVSFVGVLAPAVILVVLALKELTKAWSGVKETQEQAKASALAIAQAQQGVHAATGNLASAQKNLGIQTTEAYTAWRSQLRAVREDLLSVESASLGVKEAQLGVKESELALKEFLASMGLDTGQFDKLFDKLKNVDYSPAKILKGVGGNPDELLNERQSDERQRLELNVKKAYLSEKEAKEKLHSSNEKLTSDRAIENRYLKEGISAYAPYVAALKEAQTAQEALTTAERTLTKEQDAATNPVSKLSKEQLTLGEALHRIAGELKELFGPATSQVFKGLLEGLGAFVTAVKDPALESAFRALGKAIGDVFAQLGKTLASPEISHAFVELVKGSSALVKTLGSSIIINFIRLFTNLALAAMPAMLRIMERIGDSFKKWADDDSLVGKLRASIHHIIEEFELWAHLTSTFGSLIGAFFRAVSHEGDRLTESISKVYEKWIKFLETKKGQEEVLKFIKGSIEFTKEFFHVLGTVVVVLNEIILLAEKIYKIFSSITKVFGGTKKILEVATGGVTPSAAESLGSTVLKSVVGLAGHFASGGLIGRGFGGGDTIPFMGEAGEFVLRKEIVRAIGVPALNALNAGQLPVGVGAAGGGTGGGYTHIDQVVLPTVPGSSSFDPRVGAVKFARELSKRGIG